MVTTTGGRPKKYSQKVYNMPGICCAVNCNNSRQRNPDLQFYSIPKELHQRNKLLASIRRDHWQPISNSRLCSQHFVSGRKNDNPLSPDYVPSLFAHISTEQRQKNINANHRFDHTQQMKRKRTETFPDTDRETVVPSSIIYATEDDTLEIQAECMQGEHNYSQAIHSPGIVGPCSTTACQATVEALTNECTRLRAEVHCLKDKLDERSLNEEAFKGNDDMVQELTGLPSYAKLMVVLTFLSGFLKASPRLTPFHSFVLPLMRMRLSLPLYFFVYFFHMSKASVVRMFNSTLDVIC